MFVEMRAVEECQAVRVAREMRGRPVEKHADAFLVAAVDEIHEIVGRAEAAGHRVIADRLIAPRRIERMLHDRQQFDVRVAHLLDVGNQLVRQFAIGEPAISFIGSCAATSPAWTS